MKNVHTVHPEAMKVVLRVTHAIVKFRELLFYGYPAPDSYAMAAFEGASLAVVAALEVLRYERKGSSAWNGRLANLRALSARLTAILAQMECKRAGLPEPNVPVFPNV